MAPLLFLRVFLPFALGYFISYFFRNVNAIIEADLVMVPSDGIANDFRCLPCAGKRAGDECESININDLSVESLPHALRLCTAPLC